MAGTSLAQTSNNKPNPHALFKTAYAWVETGDTFLEQSLHDNACDAYMDALAAYERIAREFPKWNPDVVNFRIQYCRNKIEHILTNQKTSTTKKQPGPAWTGMAWTNELLEILPETQEKDLKQTIQAARLREQAAEFEHALTLYEQALAMHSVNIAAAQGAGRCCMRLGQFQHSRKHLLAAFAANPDNLDTSLLLAELACAERDFTKALRVLENVFTKHPDHPQVRFLFGSAYMGLGQIGRAEEEWLKAAELDPAFSEAHYNLARLLLMRNPTNMAGAREHYLHSVKAGGERDKHLEQVFSLSDTAPAPTPAP